MRGAVNTRTQQQSYNVGQCVCVCGGALDYKMYYINENECVKTQEETVPANLV